MENPQARRSLLPILSVLLILSGFWDQAKIAKALAPGGKGKVFCPDCGKPILLRDVIEEKSDSPAVKEQVREMQSEGQAVV